MRTRRLGKTGLEISSVVFGGNVFGWTLDETASFNMLDACLDAGLTTIDTADVYSRWMPDNNGGESETLIGNWLASRPGARENVQIFTKVGMDMGDGNTGLGERWIREAVENSLSRLKTDYIDLYFSHRFDPDTPHEETLGVYQDLINEGKVRHVGASNFTETQLEDARQAALSNSLTEYQAIQPEYSLVARAAFEGPLQRYCIEHDLGVVTYFSLASGFLSGKYRTEADLKGSSRGFGVKKYMESGGLNVLAAMDEIAADHGVTLAELALAWILHREGVSAPIASATKPSHLESLVKAADLSLSKDEVEALAID